MEYRRDIDGLRAVAVMAVVLYHADLPYIRGGYTGVDVFFVISGFLITSIVMRDIDAERFSLADFYQRRVLRLIPALLAVLAASLAGGWLLLTPAAFEDLAKSALATLGFVSNIWFWRTLYDYFASAAEFAPLLHSWSLAVEEQFYIVYPLLLLLATRWLGRPVVWVALASAASFALSLWGMVEHPYATFYLMPTRAWEMGLGALVAFAARAGAAPGRPTAEAMAAAGLLLVGYAAFVFDSATPFPGARALVPCLGAALLLWAGVGGRLTAVGRVLSLGPMVWIGLISYSLYLWHWPIFAYLRIVTGFTVLERPVALAAILASAALAYATLRLVERPLRYGAAAPLRRCVGVGGAATAVAAVAMTVALTAGAPARLSPTAARIAAAENDRMEAPVVCWDFGPVKLHPDCGIGADASTDAEGPVDFVLWGDSHALAIKPAVDRLAAQAGRRGLFAGRGACPPMDGVLRLNEYVNVVCGPFQQAVLEALERRDDIDTVILHARWARMAEGEGAGYWRGSQLLLGDAQTRATRPEQNWDIFERGLRRTAARVKATGRRVVVIGATPEIGWHVPNVLLSAERLRLDAPDPLSIKDVRHRNRRVAALFAQLQAEGLIDRVLDVAPHFCDPDCPLTLKGRPIFYDGHHVTRSTALDLLVAHPRRGPLPLFSDAPRRDG